MNGVELTDPEDRSQERMLSGGPKIRDQGWRNKIHRSIHLKNEDVRILLSEFLGTFILVLLGDGTVAQVVLGGEEAFSRSSITSINLGWGLAVTMGIFVAGGVSHGHINPAFSLVKALFGDLPWRRLPIYFLGQYAGAFCGSLIVYAVYYDALVNWEHQVPGRGPFWNTTATAGIFATYPAPYLSTWNGLLDQVVGTGVLVGMALAITDERNMEVPKGAVPLAVGAVVVVLTTAFELNCGAALNPARDLSPRVFTAIAGWGTLPFTAGNYWFWVPIVGPHLGAILGALIYKSFVSAHWPAQIKSPSFHPLESQ